jgi:hypothetical protein
MAVAAASLLTALLVNSARLLGAVLTLGCAAVSRLLLPTAARAAWPVSDDHCTFYEGHVRLPPAQTRSHAMRIICSAATTLVWVGLDLGSSSRFTQCACRIAAYTVPSQVHLRVSTWARTHTHVHPHGDESARGVHAITGASCTEEAGASRVPLRGAVRAGTAGPPSTVVPHPPGVPVYTLPPPPPLTRQRIHTPSVTHCVAVVVASHAVHC